MTWNAFYHPISMRFIPNTLIEVFEDEKRRDSSLTWQTFLNEKNQGFFKEQIIGQFTNYISHLAKQPDTPIVLIEQQAGAKAGSFYVMPYAQIFKGRHCERSH